MALLVFPPDVRAFHHISKAKPCKSWQEIHFRALLCADKLHRRIHRLEIMNSRLCIPLTLRFMWIFKDSTFRCKILFGFDCSINVFFQHMLIIFIAPGQLLLSREIRELPQIVLINRKQSFHVSTAISSNSIDLHAKLSRLPRLKISLWCNIHWQTITYVVTIPLYTSVNIYIYKWCSISTLKQIPKWAINRCAIS